MTTRTDLFMSSAFNVTRPASRGLDDRPEGGEGKRVSPPTIDDTGSQCDEQRAVRSGSCPWEGVQFVFASNEPNRQHRDDDEEAADEHGEHQRAVMERRVPG